MLNKARAEGVVRVVTDQTLSPTYTHDLAIKIEELVLQAALGLFHIVNAGECSWFEFAKGVFDLAGVRVRTKPVNSDETIRPAPRPSYSALASERLAEIGSTPLRPWKDALRDYLQTKGVI
jgi:dTDP-4-dehydrorhamnose reductase